MPFDPNHPDVSPSKLSKDHSMTINGKTYWVDAYLQDTYEKPSPPEEKWTNVKPETRTRTTTGHLSDGGAVAGTITECREVGTLEHWQQTWGIYWVFPYQLVKKRSKWFYVGVGLALLGAAAIIVASAGAMAGPTAAGAATLWSTAGATASGFAWGVGALGTGGLVGGGTIATFNKEKDEDAQGESAGAPFEQDIPMEAAAHLVDATPNAEKVTWHPC